MANILLRKYKSVFYVSAYKRLRLFNIFLYIKKELEGKRTGKGTDRAPAGAGRSGGGSLGQPLQPSAE